MTAAMLLVALALGDGLLERARVDLIELNHFLPGGGKAFSQVIFWEWSPDHRRFDVSEWYIADSLPEVPQCLPGGGAAARWSPTPGRFREVTSPLFRETWTRSDPEREHRRFMEERFRCRVWLRCQR